MKTNIIQSNKQTEVGVNTIAPVVTFAEIKRDPLVNAYITIGNDCLATLGYTEHGYRHVGVVAHISRNVLEKLGFPPRECELAGISGYMHDIGNSVNRNMHSHNGAILAAQILSARQMDPKELALVISAIGNHDEGDGQPVNNVSAALILADKSDVHRSRVRNTDFATFDIHDRVNYAVERSMLNVLPDEKKIVLELAIDTKICPLIEYFEIFTARMLMCRRAADFLKCNFELMINNVRLL